MSWNVIKRNLGHPYWSILLGSVVALPLLVSLALFGFRVNAWLAILFCATCLAWIGGACYSIWQLWHLNGHRDLQLLARYGPLSDLLAELQKELANRKLVKKIGGVRSFHLADLGDPLTNTEVWLTPSWLICMNANGTRMQFFRLDHIVAAYRDGPAVLVIDHLNVRARIPGNDADVTRLLAEILVRVPWALNHFDEQAEQGWKENRTDLIAQVEQRRREIQQKEAPS
jgi:hypothetical protein